MSQSESTSKASDPQAMAKVGDNEYREKVLNFVVFHGYVDKIVNRNKLLVNLNQKWV